MFQTTNQLYVLIILILDFLLDDFWEMDRNGDCFWSLVRIPEGPWGFLLPFWVLSHNMGVCLCPRIGLIKFSTWMRFRNQPTAKVETSTQGFNGTYRVSSQKLFRSLQCQNMGWTAPPHQSRLRSWRHSTNYIQLSATLRKPSPLDITASAMDHLELILIPSVQLQLPTSKQRSSMASRNGHCAWAELGSTIFGPGSNRGLQSTHAGKLSRVFGTIQYAWLSSICSEN